MLAQAIRTEGESLVQGMRNLAEDARKGRITISNLLIQIPVTEQSLPTPAPDVTWAQRNFIEFPPRWGVLVPRRRSVYVRGGRRCARRPDPPSPRLCSPESVSCAARARDGLRGDRSVVRCWVVLCSWVVLCCWLAGGGEVGGCCGAGRSGSRRGRCGEGTRELVSQRSDLLAGVGELTSGAVDRLVTLV